MNIQCICIYIQAVNLDSDLSAGVRLGFQPGGLRLFCQCLSSCLSSLERMSSLDPLRRNFYADSKADALMMQSASSTSSTSISVHLQCNFNMWIPTFQYQNRQLRRPQFEKDFSRATCLHSTSVCAFSASNCITVVHSICSHRSQQR